MKTSDSCSSDDGPRHVEGRKTVTRRPVRAGPVSTTSTLTPTPVTRTMDARSFSADADGLAAPGPRATSSSGGVLSTMDGVAGRPIRCAISLADWRSEPASGARFTAASIGQSMGNLEVHAVHSTPDWSRPHPPACRERDRRAAGDITEDDAVREGSRRVKSWKSSSATASTGVSHGEAARHVRGRVGRHLRREGPQVGLQLLGVAHRVRARERAGGEQWSVSASCGPSSCGRGFASAVIVGARNGEKMAQGVSDVLDTCDRLARGRPGGLPATGRGHGLAVQGSRRAARAVGCRRGQSAGSRGCRGVGAVTTETQNHAEDEVAGGRRQAETRTSRRARPAAGRAARHQRGRAPDAVSAKCSAWALESQAALGRTKDEVLFITKRLTAANVALRALNIACR